MENRIKMEGIEAVGITGYIVEKLSKYVSILPPPSFFAPAKLSDSHGNLQVKESLYCSDGKVITLTAVQRSHDFEQIVLGGEIKGAVVTKGKTVQENVADVNLGNLPSPLNVRCLTAEKTEPRHR